MEEGSAPLSTLSENELEDYIRNKYNLMSASQQGNTSLSRSETVDPRQLCKRSYNETKFHSSVSWAEPQSTHVYNKPTIEIRSSENSALA